MGRAVTWALLQLPVPAEAPQDVVAANRRRAQALLSQAARAGAHIAVLGEHFATMGVPLSQESVAQGAACADAILEEVAHAARAGGMYVVAPLWRLAQGAYRNSAAIVDPDGNVAGFYDKVHLTDGELAAGLMPGHAYPVFALPFGQVGILICHDLSFPESARCLMLGGAEVIVWPHVQSGWGDCAWDAVLCARAIDNGVWLASSSYGVPDGVAWRPGMIVGRSGLVDPWGMVVAQAGRAHGLAVATIDLDRRRLAHSFCRPGDYDFRTEVLRSRRPGTYGAIASLGGRGT